MPLEYNSTTTLARIRAAHPCEDGWTKLLAHLGKTKPDDEPLGLLTVLDSNGLDDALWVLSYAMPDDRLARHFQAWCAEQVLHIYEAEYPDDGRIRKQIEALRNDDLSDEERDAARTALGAAAGAALGAALGATARTALGAAAGAALGATARYAAGAAAWAVAYDAALTAQEAQLRKMLTQEVSK